MLPFLLTSFKPIQLLKDMKTDGIWDQKINGEKKQESNVLLLVLFLILQLFLWINNMWTEYAIEEKGEVKDKQKRNEERDDRQGRNAYLLQQPWFFTSTSYYKCNWLFYTGSCSSFDNSRQRAWYCSGLSITLIKHSVLHHPWWFTTLAQRNKYTFLVHYEG